VADPAHDPIVAALAQHRLALFVHGSRPPAPERLLGPSIMINVVGIPQDGASAVASFIATDVLARHPTLKLGFAHGGGTFAAVLDRMDFVWREMPALRETSACSPREYVRRFYFDNITYSVPFARYLLDAYGADVLMSGSDGPTKGAQQNLSAFALEVCGGNETAATNAMAQCGRLFRTEILGSSWRIGQKQQSANHRLDSRVAAIDRQHCTGNVRRRRRSQPDDSTGNFVNIGDALHRNTRQHGSGAFRCGQGACL
jgi:hypothetical protein